MEGQQAKPTKKLHIGEKKTKQPETYPTRKTPRAYLLIQRIAARSTQERVYRTSPRPERLLETLPRRVRGDTARPRPILQTSLPGE